MAAFTTLALLGLAGAAGLIGGKALASKGQGDDATGGDPKGPHATLGGSDTPKPPTAPPSLALTSSNAAVAASDAAARTRRRAQTGNTLLTGPVSSQPPATAKLQPKSLLGY